MDYAGWEGQYFTFVSKGDFQALKEWIDYRELSGEITDGNSGLMRDLWDTGIVQGKGLATKTNKIHPQE